TATQSSWVTEYRGNAALALLSHIQDCVSPPPRDTTRGSSAHDDLHYAKYTALVQSSGMGKSRTVDELSKYELVIPMVLQGSGYTGYPPGDQDVYAFLSSRCSSDKESFNRACAFLQAVFEETKSILEGMDIGRPVAEQFRARMTDEMTGKSHGQYRVEFYRGAIQKANSVSHDKITMPRGDVAGEKSGTFMRGDDYLLNRAFRALFEVIKKFPAAQMPDSQGAENREPVVVISLDEVHGLTLLENEVSNFIQLRRALRALSGKRVFTLLLSTAGKLYTYIPTPALDPSRRFREESHVYNSFGELGFDQFAKPLFFKASDNRSMETDQDVIKLSDVSEGKYLYFYGRPLWATRYDRGDQVVKDEMIRFATEKLMGTKSIPDTMTSTQELACLAQRLPLELLAVSYNSDPQSVLVQSHMRVVTRVNGNLETMITLSPSEPILSEAAYMLMQKNGMHPAHALERALSGFSVHPGDKGELLVMLLLTIARDQAVGPANDFGEPRSGTRWCNLENFLSNLFSLKYFDVIRNDLISDVDIKDSKLYFSHFVRTQEHKLVHVECLMRLMVRGAATFCAHGQPGVDLIIPFLVRGDAVEPNNIGLILIQVKNNKAFTSNFEHKDDIFRSMRLGPLGLSPDVPVIRFMFGLAAQEEGVQVIPPPSQPRLMHDFWVTGLSSHVFKAVSYEGTDLWKGLLDASYGWEAIYNSRSTAVTNLRRTMYPGSAAHEMHWMKWCVNPPQ
ncbi:hypothetical protein J3R83DRAFT_8816, partial [Lanmaoa asiatica]